MFLSAYAISIIFDNALLIRVLSVLTAKYDSLASNEVGWLKFHVLFHRTEVSTIVACE